VKPLTVLREPPDPPYPAVFRVLASDAVYEVRTTTLGTFATPLPSELGVKGGFHPAVPPCPAALLLDALDLFRREPGLEAVADVVYDPEKRAHRLFVPEQKDRTRGSVTYRTVGNAPDSIPYMNLHSHGDLPAFFSPTDDEHEKRIGLYGVVGRVSAERPQLCLRYAGGKDLWGPVPTASVFDDAPCVEEAFEVVAYEAGAGRNP
jgi:hypothetical protein